MAYPLTPLWAMHISDGVLTMPWLVGGFLLAAILALIGGYRLRDEEIPRVALLTAAGFVATLMHVRLGPTSVHLLLNGLLGVVLGRRAPLAILVALGLQAALLQHGGLTTLGVNSCVIALPALLGAGLFGVGSRPAWTHRPPWPFVLGFVVGGVAVLSSACLNAAVLLWGGAADWHGIVTLVFLAHLPLAPVEGVVVGFTVSFLTQVKPDMLAGWQRLPPLEESSSIETSTPRPQSLVTTRPPVLLLALVAGLLLAAPGQAHRLKADHRILPDHKIAIESYFDLTGDPPQTGSVKVFDADGTLLHEGKLDEQGSYVFEYDRPQTFRVVVAAGAGHACEVLIPAAELGEEARLEPPVERAPLPWRDLLTGVSVVLAAAAFLMSWRNSQRLRQITASLQARSPGAPVDTQPPRETGIQAPLPAHGKLRSSSFDP
jgi:cobalt/nickel transport system permease protein